MGIKHGLPLSLGYKVFMVWGNLWKGWKNENGQMQDFIINLLWLIWTIFLRIQYLKYSNIWYIVF